MECVPDLAFLQMAAATNNEMLTKMMWPGGGGGTGGGVPGTTMKQRKTNFTSREVETLLQAVNERKETVLFGVAGGLGWARAWHEVAQQVSAVEGIHRSESDVRKKWTYLKWEAKNTSKPGRDPTSRAVLEILTSRERECAAQSPSPSSTSNSLLEQLLVPQGGVGQASVASQPSVVGGGGGGGQTGAGSPAPAPTAPKKAVPAAPAAPPEVCLRWNSYHSNMQATFPSLLNNEQFVDVTLACEGRSIKCHKVMLSACSSYFEELLSQNPCQHPIVFMRDLKFWEVQALVEFMYTGEVNVAQDKLPSLLTAAEALQIKGLTNPSGGSFAGGSSSHEEDAGAGPEEEQPLPNPPAKRQRKRKSNNPISYTQKTQVYSGAQTPPGAPPGLAPMRLVQPAVLAQALRPPPPPRHYLPPNAHSPYVSIKAEPDDSYDTLLDLSETDRKDTSLTHGNNQIPTNHEPLSLEHQGSSSNGSVPKTETANGLSEDDHSSECSEPQSMHIDPGEVNDA